ncbi:peptidylprolyl isomerase [Chloroflexota bacterium]
MSQSGKKRTGKRAAGKTESTEVRVVYRNQISRRTAIVISVIVIALISIIIGISTYFSADSKYMRLDVITVDDVSVSMDYFLKRIRISGSDPTSMLGVIAKEKLISIVAPQLGIEISDEVIEQELIRAAQGASETISEEEYKEWYRQLLNESRLSDSEYKEIIANGLMAGIIQQYLAEQMPTVAEHIHAHYIMTITEKEAEQVKARLEAGEDFAAVARETSIDTTTKDNGGDLGWTPRGVMNPQVEYAAWEMDIGTISEPTVLFDIENITNTEPLGYFIIMVSEKTDSLEIDEEYIPILQDTLFDGWFAEEMENHEIKYHGLYNGFDSEAYAWINWQMSKLEE